MSDTSTLAPPARVSRAWISTFTLAWFGYWIASLVPINLLLPLQFAALDPDNKVRDLAIANGAAGGVALIALPICGALCDRTSSRLGQRRIWIIGGVALFAAALALMGQQAHWMAVVVLWAIAMVGASAAMAGLTAIVADRIPEAQRGVISSAIYGPQAFAVVVGIAVVTALAVDSMGGYIFIAVMVAVAPIPFLWRYREALTAPAAPLRIRAIIASLWVDPRRYPDFGWAFGSRLFVNFGNTLGTCYLLYFLTDSLRLEDPESKLLVASLIYMLSALVTTYVVGWLSDRLHKRRIFVAITALMQAAAGLLLALFPSFEMTLVTSALMGGGFGAFMAVDQAVVTQVLPHANSRAKDLGIMNVGSVVPTALAPLAAALLITSLGGYPTLFAVTGLFTALGAILIYRVRSVP